MIRVLITILSIISKSCQSIKKIPDDFFNRFKKLIGRVLGRKGVFGTHTLRKTGYLLAIWGGGLVEHIMLSARHSTISSAQKYYQDAAALLQMAKVQRLWILSFFFRKH